MEEDIEGLRRRFRGWMLSLLRRGEGEECPVCVRRGGDRSRDRFVDMVEMELDEMDRERG